MSQAQRIPKDSKPTLVPYPGLYAVADGPIYNYFPIIVGKMGEGNFVEILKPPIVAQAGYVTIEGKLYFVTLRDLFRRKVNVRNSPINPDSGSISTTSGSTGNTGLSPATVDQGSKHPEQPRPSQVSEFQVNETINLAWQDQIDALLHLEDPEAEWDIMEDNPQPGRHDESSAVQTAN